MVNDDIGAYHITSKALEFLQSVETEIPNVYRSTNTSTNNAIGDGNINVKTNTWWSLMRLVVDENSKHNIYVSVFTSPSSAAFVPPQPAPPLSLRSSSSPLASLRSLLLWMTLVIRSFMSSLLTNQRQYRLLAFYLKFLLVSNIIITIIIIVIIIIARSYQCRALSSCHRHGMTMYVFNSVQ